MRANLLRSEPTEAAFTRMVIELAHLYGWLAYHPLPLRTAKGWATGTQGDPGFPDVVLARRGVVLLVELKVGKNTPTPAQRRWIEASGARVWYPRDWDEIEEALR